MSGPGTVPVVRVALGDPIEGVRDASTYPLPRSAEDPDQPIAVTEPVCLEYPRRDGVLVFPPARFLTLTITSGHVTGVRVSPQLSLLTAAEARTLAHDLIETIEAAQWKRDPGSRTAVEDCITRLDAGTARAASLGRWWFGDDRLDLSLRRSPDAALRSADYRPGEPARAFTLRASVYNRSIVERHRPG